jgi:hypothetical protein
MFALALAPSVAHADQTLELAPVKSRGFTIEAVETALTAYEQRGFGYQSKANAPLLAAGSQRLTVFQPQILVLARQNEHITHRFWLPIDIVTSASANAIDIGRGPLDAMSNASRQNQSIAFDWATSYEAPKSFTATARSTVHAEENFRSLSTGFGTTVSFADDSAVAAASANQTLDWFSTFDALGFRQGRTTRSTTNGNVGLTQIVTATTVVHANYGLSAQYGQMSNTWNTVPFDTVERLQEHLPRHRTRHALVGRFAQFLPWNGALKGIYRFYADDWGLVAHAAELQLLQRVSPLIYLRGSYRFYTQTAVDFFTTLGDRSMTQYTADSDLGRFDSHTVGFKVSADVPALFRGAHVDVGYERYWRTDGLTVNVALWQAGAHF